VVWGYFDPLGILILWGLPFGIIAFRIVSLGLWWIHFSPHQHFPSSYRKGLHLAEAGVAGVSQLGFGMACVPGCLGSGLLPIQRPAHKARRKGQKLPVSLCWRRNWLDHKVKGRKTQITSSPSEYFSVECLAEGSTIFVLKGHIVNILVSELVGLCHRYSILPLYRENHHWHKIELDLQNQAVGWIWPKSHQ
jgi:hypothetical protein